jgi:V-type H+-transporting ATPase subunit C
MQTVQKLDEETRNKAAFYNDLKAQKANISQKSNTATLAGRDLVDVLTPDVVTAGCGAGDDFVYTDHITTVCVILPRGGDVEFLKSYEYFNENVVPGSAKHFKSLDDKDGNSLWRVVMFRSAVDQFKKECRDKRFLARDFEYKEEAYKQLKTQRDQIDDQVKRQHDMVRGLYQAAWSDTMVAWMHVKATRVFVESVLRFGMPPRFASFIIAPRSQASQAALTRKALAEILGSKGGAQQGAAAAAGGYGGDMEDGEEYFPYVSFSLQPFVAQR